MSSLSLVICVSVLGSDPYALSAGSEQDACSECEQAVWVAPSSLSLMAENSELRLVCVQCATTLLEAEPEPGELMPPTREQMIELAEWAKRHLE